MTPDDIRDPVTGWPDGAGYGQAEVAARLEAEIRPLLDVDKYDGGYDCCGCSTYGGILDHAIRIALAAAAPATPTPPAAPADTGGRA